MCVLITWKYLKYWDKSFLINIPGCQRNSVAPPRAQKLKLVRKRMRDVSDNAPRFLPHPLSERLLQRHSCTQLVISCG